MIIHKVERYHLASSFERGINLMYEQGWRLDSWRTDSSCIIALYSRVK